MTKLSLFDRIIRRYRDSGFISLTKQTILKAQTFVRPVKLLSVACELTNVCNLKCPFCFVEKSRKTGFMSWELFKKVVDESANLDIEVLGLNYGGESLCHPEFKRFLEYAIKIRDMGFFKNVGWVDNGTLFNRDIANLVCELNVDNIAFSLEGFSEVNDKERVGCNYEQVKNNILYLLERRGDSTVPAIRINTLNPANNLDFIKYWVDKVELVSWSTVRNMNNQVIDKSFFEQGEGFFTPKRCSFPYSYLGVLWDGKINGCCSDGYGKMNLGDANTQTLKQVWNGQAFKDLRANFDNELCRKCDFWKLEFVPCVESVFNNAVELIYQRYWKMYRRKI
jgi:radical SAM protein with 4Fe4S-binding SPASM domain